MANKRIAIVENGKIKAIGSGDTPVDGSGGPIGGSVTAVWVQGAPTGTIGGGNVTFTLPGTPDANSLILALDGIVLDPGASDDYTLSTNTITMLVAPASGSKLTYFYTTTTPAVTYSGVDETNTDAAKNKLVSNLLAKGWQDHKNVVTGNPHSVTKSEVGLSSVTNDSQLKRSANDFSTFTEKTTLVNDDLILIEDSADSGTKKKVKKSNLGVGGGSLDILQVQIFS